MKKLVRLLAIIMLSISVAVPAYAASTGGNLNVNASVVASCSVSVTGINFGSYDGSAEATANGNVSCTCTNGASYDIALSAGNNLSGGSRRLGNGSGSYLNYSLRKPDDTTAWGDSDHANTFSGGASLTDTGSGGAQSHTVYGHLPSGQLSAVTGAYNDTVVVTVYY